MKQEQINRLEMYQTTNDYLDAQNAVWSAIPIIGKYKNELTDLVTAIKTAAADQADAQVFVGKTIAGFKRQIATKMDMLDDIMEAYALDVENAELAQQAANSTTSYFSLPYEDFEIKVRQVIGLLETHLGAMADYGMSAEQIEDVKLDFDQFLVRRGKPRSYQIASRVATLDIDALFKEGTTITEKLDRVLKRFKRANASFYNGYIASRKIIGD